ncbi:MAG: DUF4124 domain-containing protein [Gammaproteobacteria bacterium]|nr:DUF4124 domain-containing protein [Gammaproteobacteria bacterium]MBU1555421.1 DUF4124 domain-containing protein [Gammaproteobacteria bacterium]MBU2070289.1 DUF4124 domain-containing protein [Gammaproteobacteria bacterium]MBU2185327.1 DUF4124 domain-containing protein [Gammaproteobacteria bacterium]MBU2203579.1 DUF4124 domain-containing protein [Gammaproteobacteria bacterium]
MKPVLIVLLLPFLVSAEVYKCEIDGVVTYSQDRCSAEAEVTAYATEDLVTASQQPILEANANSAAATMDRLSDSVKKRDMRLLVNKLKLDKENKLKQRDIKLAELKSSKEQALNNLAGAVWEESLSKEMAAVAIQYDTDIRGIDTEIDRLVNELNRI